MEQAAADIYQSCRSDDGLIIAELEKHHIALRRRVVRMALAKISPALKDVTSAHIDMAMELTATGKSVELPGGVRAVREYGVLRFALKPGDNSEKREIASYEIVPGETVYAERFGVYVRAEEINGGAENPACAKNERLFDRDRLTGPLYLRSRKTGDRIYVSEMGGHKKLKDYFIDEKIPRENRANIPLVADDSGVIWIVDGKNMTDSRRKASAASRNVLKITIINALNSTEEIVL
jgi:tRNA(Ile)-lysidine synthase